MQVVERTPDALFARCNELIPAGRFGDAIPLLRQLLTFFPGNAIIRNNLADALTATGQRALLSDFTDDLTPAELGTHLFLACMPKSGSSFLTNCLMRLSGFAQAHWSFAYMQAEQELYLPHVLADARNRVVIQQHCRATEANLQIMDGFGIRPIVMVRELADIVISLLDFYENGAVATTFLSEDFAKLDRSARIDALIDMRLPWYLQFYVSWDQARRRRRIETLWLDYAEMTTDKPGTLARIARFHGFDWSGDAIAHALAEVEGNRAANRFNVGRRGRGAETLTQAQKARIARLARPYPSVDFTPLGL